MCLSIYILQQYLHVLKKSGVKIDNNFAKSWPIFKVFSLLKEDKFSHKTCIKISTTHIGLMSLSGLFNLVIGTVKLPAPETTQCRGLCVYERALSC